MSQKPKCCLCGSSTEDPLNLGEMKTCKGYNAHYYCLLLSSTIRQSGEDDEGILGFLPSDIYEELQRSKTRTCTYCKKSGASVICNAKSCKTVFHLPCGIKNNSGHQFYGRFLSNCFSHRPKQKFNKPKEPAACPICYDDVDFNAYSQVLWAPCCKKNSYFHKNCLQQMALSAGYFFKCPICNNTDVFQKTMKHFGVFIPDRDASWELVPNAFEELLYRHEECNAKVCLCFRGRKYSNVGPWTIVLCSTCGSQGTHLSCSRLRKDDVWYCIDCTTKLPEPIKGQNYKVNLSNNVMNGTVSGVRPINVDRPSTSRGLPVSERPVPIPSQDAASNQSRKRKRNSSETGVNGKAKQVKPSTSTASESTNSIEIDSDSDVVVIEEDEPSYKCLLAKGGKVLPVKNISTNETHFSVQGDLNITEKPKKTDGLMNVVISDVRSLKESSPIPRGSKVDNNNQPSTVPKTRQTQKNGVNNYVVYTPSNNDDKQKNTVSVIDTQGNVYILKEIMGYQIFQNKGGVEDQNNQNAKNYNNNGQDGEIVVID